MSVVVRIDALGEKELRVTPSGYLGGSLWNTYLDACGRGGAGYRPAQRAQIAPADRFFDLVNALQRAGFKVSLDRALEAALAELRQKAAERTEEARESVEAATDRLDRIEAELADRGLRLYPFQRTGVRWLAARYKALLADEMGLGKTVQALIAIPDGAPVLVVAPAAVKGVWQREAKRWRPEFRVTVLQGRGSFRWPSAGEIVVVNYDVLPEYVDEDGEAPEKGKRFQPRSLFVESPNETAPGTVVIADEAHAVKNKKAERTRRFIVVARRVVEAKGRCWLLTGTPMLNRPPELWNVLSAASIAEEAFGDYRRFCSLFNAHKTRFGTEWGKASDQVPELLKRVSLHRRRAEVLPDLPTKTYRTVEVTDLDERTVQFLDDVMQRLLEKGVDVTAEHFDTERISAPAFEELSRARAQLALAKTPAMVALVEEFEAEEQPLVVFSAHRAPIDYFAGRPRWAIITGDTSPEDRTRIVEAFQGGQLLGVALTIAAGGVGLTLTRAHQLLFVDLAWTPALNGQAEDRCCRIGQDRGVVVTRLVAAHPVDERVMELLAQKQELIAGSVEASARVEVEDVIPQEEALPAGFEVHEKQPEQERATDAPKSAAGVPQVTTAVGKFRPPKDATERWAADGMVQLASLDGDYAQVVNGMGFSKMDGEFGHSLANALRAYGRLSDKQWSAAVRLAQRYRRQIGAPPENETPEVSAPGASAGM